ncbi:hypothetical protein CI109_100296 [Kwoniella shandongensis]|uniref:Uncharacterized protein n=1 Tax=Kwoniella shandongensis TaxID=1734106 RepID=A0A5M6C9Q2_9TREE|nr:uncharacterized protein CI109_001859 [Kwoniella shandongensis]KAA5529919.1 hypothetical protein CI109_001859 [Kwoniella shandongensis]
MPYSYVVDPRNNASNPSSSSSTSNQSGNPITSSSRPEIWPTTPLMKAKAAERHRIAEAQRNEAHRQAILNLRRQEYLEAESEAAIRLMEERDERERREKEEEERRIRVMLEEIGKKQEEERRKWEQDERMRKEKMEREEWERGVPYYTPVIGARVGFRDLPLEVLRKVVGYSEKRYPYLILCKETCLIAGPLIYEEVLGATTGPHIVNDETGDHDDPIEKRGAKASSSPFASDTSKFGIGGVTLGLEHFEPSEKVPLGRELKLQFLSGVRSIVEQKWWSNPGPGWAEWNVFSLAKAREDNIVVFPNLDRMVLNQRWVSDPATHLRPKQTSTPTVKSADKSNQHLTLAAVSRPKYFCWWTPFHLHDLQDGTLLQTELLFARQLDSGNAQRHVPLAVCHHQTMATSLPLVCYGTLNRVDFWHPSEEGVYYHSQTSIGQLEIRQRANVILKILRISHPELVSPDEFSLEELERRGKTRWEFSQIGSDNSYDVSSDEEEDGGLDWWEMCERVKEMVLEGVPEMKGRIKFEEENEELDKCGSCGMSIPFDEEAC